MARADSGAGETGPFAALAGRLGQVEGVMSIGYGLLLTDFCGGAQRRSRLLMHFLGAGYDAYPTHNILTPFRVPW